MDTVEIEIQEARARLAEMEDHADSRFLVASGYLNDAAVYVVNARAAVARALQEIASPAAEVADDDTFRIRI